MTTSSCASSLPLLRARRAAGAAGTAEVIAAEAIAAPRAATATKRFFLSVPFLVR
jgi:hypothetical protein